MGLTAARHRRNGAAAVVVALLVSLALARPPAGAAPARALPVQAAPATDVWYTLVNRHSGKAMDVLGFSTADGGDVVQWADLGGANQQWRLASSGDGWYRLINRHSGKALDVFGWSTANGADVVQWADLGGANQQWRLGDAGGGYVTLTNRHSGQALEVWTWSTADGGDVVQWPATGGANQQWRLVPAGPTDGGGGGGGGGGGSATGLAGWATQGGGTTGGGSAAPTTVTSASALSSALSAGGARVIRVSGTINCSGMLRVTSDKSVLGNPGAALVGCGLNISEASNVIVRNISFRNWADDAVNVQMSQRVWIDHNSFSNGFDGAVDIKRGSDYVTVSWNRVFDHDKSMLLGHSDDNASQDVGHLRVTYHHNWFDGSGTRHPRVRFGNPVHVYNNFYSGNEYGVASTMNAGVLVEGNYFENVEDPTLVGYADSDAGSLVQRNNQFVGSGTPQSAGSVARIPYTYSLDSAGAVRGIVSAGAGAGRITP
ncbi:MAG TPA: RICIN domain-containing protein [Acidimicrobiales bacterium]|nr:RICIN domain-containing protein [Acidimicrobiales bacterium]